MFSGIFFFFSSRRRHTRLTCDWSSDVCSSDLHHGDTGGGVPGGYNVTANDIWGEGVRWPVVKVIDRGEERRDVLYALQANNRLPDYIGDLRAQIGAAQLGAGRLGSMLSRYG